MASPTAVVLTGFISWALALLVLMEVIRAKLVLSKEVAADGFDPNNSGLSPFMQRLARAHANCVEGLPIFGGLMLVALITANTGVTDTLAYVFLAARITQSLIHLASVRPAAITMRFSAFAVQFLIGIYWSFGLLQSMLA